MPLIRFFIALYRAPFLIAETHSRVGTVADRVEIHETRLMRIETRCSDREGPLPEIPRTAEAHR